jgi:hypothetical protein
VLTCIVLHQFPSETRTISGDHHVNRKRAKSEKGCGGGGIASDRSEKCTRHCSFSVEKGMHIVSSHVRFVTHHRASLRHTETKQPMGVLWSSQKCGCPRIDWLYFLVEMVNLATLDRGRASSIQTLPKGSAAGFFRSHKISTGAGRPIAVTR